MQNEESQVLGMEDLGTTPEQSMPTEGAQQIEKPKDKPKDTEAESKLINKMMFSPSSSEADPTITLDKTSDVKEFNEEKAKSNKDLLNIIDKGNKKESDKYKKELWEMAKKDPTSVEIKTPRGWMSVQDAIANGFDLVDGDFTRDPLPPKRDFSEEISKLSPNDQEAIKRLTGINTPQAGRRPAPEEAPAEGVVGAEGETMEPQAIGENVGPEGNVTPDNAGMTEQGSPILPGINDGGGSPIPLG